MNAYCDKSDVEKIYGVSNVATWADLDNDRDQVKMDARIEENCELATTKMNNRLRGGVIDVDALVESSSSSGNMDAELVSETARWAGVLLYSARGIDDNDDEDGRDKLSSHYKLVQTFIRSVRTGRIRLDIATIATVVPKVVDSSEWAS